jgi:hypothetical protein
MMESKLEYNGTTYEFEFVEKVKIPIGLGIEKEIEYDLYYFILNGKVKTNIKIQLRKSGFYGMGKGSNWVLIIYKGKELEYSEYQFNYFIDDIDCIISFREFTDIINKMKLFKTIK